MEHCLNSFTLTESLSYVPPLPLQGVTGSPGSTGPDGKVGPAVSCGHQLLDLS